MGIPSRLASWACGWSRRVAEKTLDEFHRILCQPGLGDQLPQLGHDDRVQADQNHRVAVEILNGNLVALGVAVRADQQGRGAGRGCHGSLRGDSPHTYQLGALNAVESAADFYAHCGWQLWAGHTQALGPSGVVVDTYDDADRIYLLTIDERTESLETHIPLICDGRGGRLW